MKTIVFKNGKEIKLNQFDVNVLVENMNKYPDMKYQTFSNEDSKDVNLFINVKEIVFIR